MKVLTIKEPFATLIKEKKKVNETRSWKTNYRGELYIHAGVGKSNFRKEVNTYIKDMTFNQGKIVCKCRLVDCIYMTEEYVDNLKKNNPREYALGRYEVGRYAWVMDDICEVKEDIYVKGSLGFWNYYSADEVMDLMKNTQYGYVDKDFNKRFDFDNFYNDYILQSAKDVIKSGVGVCWDQVEVERYYLKGRDIHTYFICYYEKEFPSHTFLTYKENDKYYYFEHSWEDYRGIYEFDNIDELLSFVKNNFIKDTLDVKCDLDKLKIVEYSKPREHLSCREFYELMDNNTN